MPESNGDEKKKIKVYADGNGGLYVKPEDVFRDPDIREKIKELNEIGPMAKSPPKESSQEIDP